MALLSSLVRTQRIVAPLAAAFLVLAGLTSCFPPPLARTGITGLTVDVDGRPLAVLTWCGKRPPDRVILMALPDPDSAGPSGVATPPPTWPSWPERDWAVPRNATSPATVPLDDFPPKSFTDPDVVFLLQGVADDHTFASDSVEFRLGELAGLAPASILITTGNYDVQAQRTITPEEFARRGHDRGGC